jgi:hypothetical protein
MRHISTRTRILRLHLHREISEKHYGTALEWTTKVSLKLRHNLMSHPSPGTEGFFG